MRLNFKYEGNTFDFNLRKRITLIDGDSATGKTLFSKSAAMYFRESTEISVLGLQRTMSEENFKMWVENNKGSIIIIDSANLFLTEQIKEIINYDFENRYILMGRDISNIQTTPDTLAEIVYDPINKKFTLDYYF